MRYAASTVRVGLALAAGGALLSLVCTPALALDRDRDIAQLSHTRWTVREGVPGQVGALAQTRDGYLWLGTDRSLFRFDGIRFQRYVSPAGETLPTVSSLLAQPDGGLWVGFRAGGVAHIGEGTLARYAERDGLPAGVVYGLAVDRDGVIWAAADDGLARFEAGRWQRVSAAQGFPDENARAVFVDGAGTLWAASESHLFYLPHGEAVFRDVGEPIGRISQIGQAPDGTIWVAELFGGTLRAIPAPDARRPPRRAVIEAASAGFAFDRDGALWVGTLGDGIQRILYPGRLGDGGIADGDDPVQSFTAARGLSADYVRPVLEDREGNLWFGTSAGLDRFRHSALVRAAFPSGSHTFALAPGSDGSLWAGTINRPVMHLVAGEARLASVPPPVTCAYRDAGGVVWLAGPRGIWQARDEALVHVAALPPGAPGEAWVRAMTGDGDGTLWVSINRLGLFKLRDGAWTAAPRYSQRPDQIMPVTASTDAQGRLWFGYRNSTVVTVAGDDVRVRGPDDGLGIGHVTAMYHGARQTWVGGQLGLAWFDGARFHSLPTADDSLRGIYAIIETPAGDLWVHALGGIFHLPAGEVQRAVAGAARPIATTTFDVVDGMPDDPNQVRPLPTAVQGTDGRLWFATSNGVVWLDPERLYENASPPPVLIETLIADGEPLAAARPAAVPALTNRLTIEYTALSLAVPERVRFRYRLEGFDTAWQEAGNRREAHYTGLGPGGYRFRVIAADGDGRWSEPGAMTELTVLPAFHETTTFLVMCIAAVAGVLWLLYRIRLHQVAARLRLRLEERHEERERIARELHDTLLQGVQGLMLRFHAAMMKLPPQDPARRQLEQALDRADEVLVEGRDRVKGLRGATGSGDLSQAFIDVGRELEQDQGAAFRVTVEGRPRHLDPMVREEVYGIGREALVNAFRHARAQQIEVEICHRRGELRLRVRDDGCGIDPQLLAEGGRPGHWGLSGMQERARRIRASLQLWSRPGTGTEIDLVVPGALAYHRRRARHP